MTGLYFADKPAGLTTHGDGSRGGFVECLSERSGADLKVVHRLDRDTTGAMIFAADKRTAQEIQELFEAGRIRKRYLFLTDRVCRENELTVESHIRQAGKTWISEAGGPHNAFTAMKLLSSSEGFSVWEAFPRTGKTHQVRLHAAQAGIPLLGDTAYGGSPFPQVMLHSQKIESPPLFTHESPAPLLFSRPGLCRDPFLPRWLCQYDFRTRFFPDAVSSPHESLRLIDDKEHGHACDKFGGLIWFYRFSDEPVRDDERSAMETFRLLTGAESFVLRQMENRGRTPHLEPEARGHEWTARENGVSYRLSSIRGWSPGLFLDQRANRSWVRENSRGRSVLNLFCYSGGFSVNAALGGAREVVSVDTSKSAVAWAKENFALNALDAEKYEFWTADSRTFLHGALRRARKFDLIVCDPPSFARSKSGLFRLETEAPRLIFDMAGCLNDGGRILFSCNFEGWSRQRLTERIKIWIRGSSLTLEETPEPERDFAAAERMKSFFLRKS